MQQLRKGNTLFNRDRNAKFNIEPPEKKKTFADIAIEDYHNEISTNRILDFQILLL